jgi:hypothetical protein
VLMSLRAAKPLVSVLVVMLLQSCAGSDSASAPSSTTTTVAAADSVPPVDADVAAVALAIDSLTPGDPAGFAPEVLEEVDDVASILPPGATLDADAASIVVDGDAATVDATLTMPDGSTERHWVLLDRRDDAWLVVLTIPLPAS